MTPNDIRKRADTYRYRDEVHAKTSRILDALADVLEACDANEELIWTLVPVREALARVAALKQ